MDAKAWDEWLQAQYPPEPGNGQSWQARRLECHRNLGRRPRTEAGNEWEMLLWNDARIAEWGREAWGGEPTSHYLWDDRTCASYHQWLRKNAGRWGWGRA